MGKSVKILLEGMVDVCLQMYVLRLSVWLLLWADETNTEEFK